MDISKLTDTQKSKLIESRWASADTVWTIVKTSYEKNIKVYKNTPDWAEGASQIKKRGKIRANRIFRDTEAVINALIGNLPKPNFLPTRDTPEAKELAMLEEKFFLKKYEDLNVKEQMRKGLRNLYFGRLIVFKPFWNKKINDFDVVSLDPRKIRVNSKSTKEENSDFVIEEIDDNLTSVMALFPLKADDLMKNAGFTTLEEAYIMNPTITYKEAWIGDHVMWKHKDTILADMRNPYWDWDGLLVTPQEEEELKGLGGEQRRNALSQIRQYQGQRAPVATETSSENPDQQDPQTELRAYLFNHFDMPRKPYIFATIFNNENSPVGQTDMIAQATPLQEGIDRRKQDIDENASLVNGQIKVDSSVMSKADAQKLRYEARGVIWGKGVNTGVTRETGTPLPQFVYEDMVDSRNEIDSIMAANSAFKGQREGTETKAGRLALIDQSYLNLNELVQVVDYCSQEIFNWFYQLAKTRYTEHHYAKVMGPGNSLKVFSLIQDDMEDGAEIRIIAGKTLPEDRQFKYEQAQKDLELGVLSPSDYFEIAGYDSADQMAKDGVKYKLNPALAVGLSPEEMQQYQPQQQPEPPSRSISFSDLPPDGQVQLAGQAGIHLDPNMLIAEKMAEQRSQQQKDKFDQSVAMKKLEKSPIQAKDVKK